MTSTGYENDTTPCSARHPRSTATLVGVALQTGLAKGLLAKPDERFSTWDAEATARITALTEDCGRSREDAVKVRVYRGEECDAIDAMQRALKLLADWTFAPHMDFAKAHPNVDIFEIDVKEIVHLALDRAPVADDVLLCGRGVEALDAALEMTFSEAIDERYT